MFLNSGLTIIFNGKKFHSRNGLVDLLNENMTEDPLYAPIHLSGDDIEVAITHGTGYGESYFSFVNGQYTSQGGTHQAAFREGIAKTIKEFYHKDYDPSDIRTSIIAAISVKVTDPVFESQTKIKLGSKEIEPGVSMRNFVLDFIGKHLDDYLTSMPRRRRCCRRRSSRTRRSARRFRHSEEGARDGQEGVAQQQEAARLPYPPERHERRQSGRQLHLHHRGRLSKRFYHEKRDPNLQAVFSLRGKPLNSFGLTKKIVYENEEFNLLQAALNIEDGLEGLRYNKVIMRPMPMWTVCTSACC